MDREFETDGDAGRALSVRAAKLGKSRHHEQRPVPGGHDFEDPDHCAAGNERAGFSIYEEHAVSDYSRGEGAVGTGARAGAHVLQELWAAPGYRLQTRAQNRFAHRLWNFLRLSGSDQFRPTVDQRPQQDTSEWRLQHHRSDSNPG